MEVTLNRYIEITPEIRTGKPRIAGTRIAVADIAMMYLQMGQSLELIAGKYDLPLASVYAAMAYYYDRQAEIEQQMQADEAFVNALMHSRPSRLQAKLKALRGE